MIDNAIVELSNSLELLRDTVHKLKETGKNGRDLINEIINEFKFCKIELSFKGNPDDISDYHYSVISVNIKEFLTNSMKYSLASLVNIEITITQKIIRLYMKDNGVGCKKIIDGMGLEGIKERVSSCNGTVSVIGDNGFMVVCILPREDVSLIENINS
jgi:signal transduction histidine kinase